MAFTEDETDPIKDMGIGKTIIDKKGNKYYYDEIVKLWSNFYQEQVNKPDSYDLDIKTSKENYDEFGKFMAEYLVANPSSICAIPDDYEDIVYYRAYAIVKNIWLAKLKQKDPDNEEYARLILIWFKLGLISIDTVLSVMFFINKVRGYYKHFNGKNWVHSKDLIF
jgi:hypothetical protein